MIVLDTHIWLWWIGEKTDRMRRSWLDFIRSKDPQDRLIIATAIHHNAQLISVDGKFSLYKELESLLVI